MLDDLDGDYLRACRNAFALWFGGGPDTLLLGRSAISALMRRSDWLDSAGAAFAELADGRAQSPLPLAIDGAGGTFHAKAASLTLDRPWVALKLNGNFPENRARHRLPTIQGAILLCDGADGRLLAILDSIEVTIRRTAAATALAARHLARADSASVLMCGCGAQAPAQLDALRGVLPIARGLCWDKDEASARTFAKATGLVATNDLRSACAEADVIVTCTTAAEPFITADMVTPGTFVAAVGADSPHKSEIAPDLMASAIVVCDVIDQCEVMGDLRHAIAAGRMVRRDVQAELAELVAGTRPGRADAGQITVFDSTGTAVQDVAAAVMIYRRALDSGGGRAIDLAA